VVVVVAVVVLVVVVGVVKYDNGTWLLALQISSMVFERPHLSLCLCQFALFTAFVCESFILLSDGICYIGIEMYLSTAYLHSNFCPFFPLPPYL
jgi:hypothetical protein